MTEPTCRTCKWYHEKDQQCRRRAPQVTILMIPQPPTIGSRGQPTMQPMPIAAFPPIGSPYHLGCGEHEAKIQLLPN